jgi:hypothetical protein
LKLEREHTRHPVTLTVITAENPGGIWLEVTVGEWVASTPLEYGSPVQPNPAAILASLLSVLAGSQEFLARNSDDYD